MTARLRNSTIHAFELQSEGSREFETEGKNMIVTATSKQPPCYLALQRHL
jgi:hypothetical protein